MLDSGFEYMNVLSCVYYEKQYPYGQFNTTIKSSTEVNYFDLPHVCLLIRWAMMHVSEMVIERFVCCMTHEEKPTIQWPCSSHFHCFAQELYS